MRSSPGKKRLILRRARNNRIEHDFDRLPLERRVYMIEEFLGHQVMMAQERAAMEAMDEARYADKH